METRTRTEREVTMIVEAIVAVALAAGGFIAGVLVERRNATRIETYIQQVKDAVRRVS